MNAADGSKIFPLKEGKREGKGLKVLPLALGASFKVGEA